MQFILSSSWSDGIAALTNRLTRELSADKKVLWLVSGGSNVSPTVEIMKSIPSDLSHNLSIMLHDERFGNPGHADSNWQQLSEVGFEPKQAKLLPILMDGLDFDQTLEHFEQQARQTLAESAIVVSQIGMGADGHVAGILPNSPSAGETTTMTAGYESSPYTRLTLTFPALRQIDVAYVLVFGEAKYQALESLKNKDLALSEQPAQILKEIPEVYIYNDQIGDEA